MNRQPFETMPDVMDAKQIAEALQISKAGAYNLLNSPDFPTLRIGGRKLVMKADLMEWLKGCTNRRKEKEHEMFLEALKKVMAERMTYPDYPFSILAPYETDRECFGRLKREILEKVKSK